MAKATTIKEALAKWEEKNGQKPSEAKEVKLYAQVPPIEKMDASLSSLVNCEKLSLSTNCIEKIANLNGLKNLRILSLGRNNIKNLNGLEAVGDTLEELWISYNQIEKLRGLHVMKKLKILYMSNNLHAAPILTGSFCGCSRVCEAGRLAITGGSGVCRQSSGREILCRLAERLGRGSDEESAQTEET
ncbi:dynein axonemal light chain 1 isoform X3 [Sphaerodactylus townsendi]|uniref:dynein axonemal light chain 1 isoform X3 n=1 Tax=Sphaerodactylus townsendi TaxID=933632 RepID=UPI0020261D2C|nr:dynein axonemal light chain 1 isoform X3 [Sphaerodactylus townsendi]